MADILASGARSSVPTLPASGTPIVSQIDLLQLLAARAMGDAIALLHRDDTTAAQLKQALHKAMRAKSALKRAYRLVTEGGAA